jgi:hypothetical protein
MTSLLQFSAPKFCIHLSKGCYTASQTYYHVFPPSISRWEQQLRTLFRPPVTCSRFGPLSQTYIHTYKQTPWFLDRKRTIPTDRLRRLAKLVSAFACSQCNLSLPLQPLISGLLTGAATLWYITIIITTLDNLHRHVFYLKHIVDNIRTSQEAHHVSDTEPNRLMRSVGL